MRIPNVAIGVLSIVSQTNIVSAKDVQCGRVDDLSLLTISERVNGGEVADIGSWPWQIREMGCKLYSSNRSNILK